MSAATEKHLNPSDLSDEALNRVAFALVGKLQKFYVIDRPLRLKEAAEYLGISQKHFCHLVNIGVITPCRPDPDGNAFYWPSQLKDDFLSRKNSQR